MNQQPAAPRPMGETVILDFLALGARAVVAALACAVALGAIVLLLSGPAQAAQGLASPTSTSAAFISL